MKTLKHLVLFILMLSTGILCLGALAACGNPTDDTPPEPIDKDDDSLSQESAPTPAQTMTVFVDAVNGSDDNIGNIVSPLATLNAAKELVRDLHSGDNRTTPVTVYLREGTHFLADTLKLSGKDSYTTYTAYEDEKVTISGGTVITSWSESSGGIWVANAKDIESRDFFVNGVRATRARTDFSPTVIDFTKETVTVSNRELADLEKPRDLEFVLKNYWNLPRICAESAVTNDDGTTTFTMVQPGWNTYYETATLGGAAVNANQFFYAENAYEFLDEPGEWYLDTAAGKIYYMPREGEDMTTADAVLGRLEQLVTLTGGKTSVINEVSFTGLTFSHTTWMQASSDAGLLTIQANFYKRKGTTAATQWSNDNWVTPSAAIEGKHTTDAIFTDNTFCNLGNAALHLSTGTKNARITKNSLYDCAGSGIMLGGFATADHDIIHKDGSNKDTNWYLVSENNLIEDNVIDNIGSVYAGGVGICVGYVRDTAVSHNTLTNLPYTGISFGWGWGCNGQELRDAYYSDENGIFLFSGNEISNNYIYNIMNVLFDGGGIYTLGRNDNTVIEGNYIEKVNNDYGAIYLDDGSVGFTVYDNVIKDAYRNYIYKGDRNHIYDNYTSSGTAKQPDYDLRTPLDPQNPDYTFENNYDWDEDAVEKIRQKAGAR
ncbi:MAG: right-handed parallel beta-helix repeat-containing protein [Clostridia bacterium]|nr:right-handed parallel beta-helix repeat-containing protein [Clostridia bacterium]